MLNFTVLPLSVSKTEAFSEASREELRVLLALIELNGIADGREAIAAVAGTSVARASAALIFWQEAGVIAPKDHTGSTITEEFENSLCKGKISERDSVAVASTIRRENLASMIAECAALMKRSMLNNSEIKDLTALYEQYALSEEYIVTLAAYLAERGRLTVTRLINKAISLTEREIDTPRALEAYIVERESESEAEREFRKIFGCYGRALSKTEKEKFKKWSHDFGYFTDIVGEAYDIAVSSTTRGYVNYADKVLTGWYAAGCKTLAECRARHEADKEEAKAKKESASKSSKKSKAPAERYGSFDVEDAFQKALDRSYGKK